MPEFIDHLVVGKLTFKESATGGVVGPAAGIPGIMTTPPGTVQKITQQPTAPATTAGSAGATYTGAEQTLINALVTQVNALTTALKNAGHLK